MQAATSVPCNCGHTVCFVPAHTARRNRPTAALFTAENTEYQYIRILCGHFSLCNADEFGHFITTGSSGYVCLSVFSLTYVAKAIFILLSAAGIALKVVSLFGW